ncbi:hypothetical protein GEV39_17870 [Pseudomonas sp. NY5710]|nr:hypothetical protein GEV39_17870 [Pseudomonas sp. NY5710]
MRAWGRFAPHRRQAGSHRYCTSFENCGAPVVAGLPAMGPEQAISAAVAPGSPSTWPGAQPHWPRPAWRSGQTAIPAR